MKNESMFRKLVGFFKEFGGKDGFGRLDFSVLKTLMRLAAVDGEVSADEMKLFREMATNCKGYDEDSFGRLWSAALHSAGYLNLQARFLGPEEMVREFVKESEGDFTEEVAEGDSAERNKAFECLEAMAKADGEYSDIERACISALAERVQTVRLAAIQARYSRAASYDK